MIRLQIGLIQKNQLPLIVNHHNYPLELCNKFMDMSEFKKSKGNVVTDETQLFYCSHLFCSNYEKDGLFIKFKSKVNFSITSSLYEVILYFVQQFFDAPSIKFGFAEFEVVSLEISDDAESNIKDDFKVISPIPYNINDILSLVENKKIV